MKGRVLVRLRSEVLDPEGAAVAQALENLGYDKIISVRQGKFFEIELDLEERPVAARMLQEMAEKLLANPVIEVHQIMLVAEPTGDAFDRRHDERRDSDDRRSGRDRREDARRAREEAARVRSEEPEDERRTGSDRRHGSHRREGSERRDGGERREGSERRAGRERREGIHPDYLGSERRRDNRRERPRRSENHRDEAQSDAEASGDEPEEGRSEEE